MNVGNLWETISACNFSKNAAAAQVFCLPYFKSNLVLEHLPIAASRNVTKHAILHQCKQCHGKLVHNGIFQ